MSFSAETEQLFVMIQIIAHLYGLVNSDLCLLFPNTEFLKLKNIYTSYSEMIDCITRDIRRYADNAVEYYQTISELRRLDVDHSKQQLIERLQHFYRKDYECMPVRGKD